MAKGAYVGVNGVARKIKGGYVGVGGVARKIKKAYVGIGGVARPCWGGNVEYYGAITPLSASRYNPIAGTIGNYAVFGYGSTEKSPYYSTAVDAYNKSLTKTLPEEVSITSSSSMCGGASVYNSYGDGHLFYSSGDGFYDYNTSLTLGGKYGWLGTTPSYPMVADNGKHVIFTRYGVAYAIDGSGVQQQLSASLQSYMSSRTGAHGVRAGNNAVFAYKKDSATVLAEAYNTSLTLSSITVPTDKKCFDNGSMSLFFNGCGLIAGGNPSSLTYVASVSKYDSSLVLSSVADLSVARCWGTATTLGDFAIFTGGYGPSYTSGGTSMNIYPTTDMYDKSFTRIDGTPLEKNTYNHSGVTVGDYALFGGGYTGTYTSQVRTQEDTVVAYTI